MPPRSAKSRSRPRIQRMPSGSRPLAGSSRISTSGSPSSAWAMPSRWRMPSEYCLHALARGARGRGRRGASSSSTRARCRRPWSRAESAERLARRVRPACWRRRVEQDADAAARVGELAVRGRRAPSRWPRVGLGEAARACAASSSCRRRWGRGSPVTVPGSQRKVTSSTTARPPKRLVRPSVSIMAGKHRRAARAAAGTSAARVDAGIDFGRGSRALARAYAVRAMTSTHRHARAGSDAAAGRAARAARGARRATGSSTSLMFVFAVAVGALVLGETVGRARRAAMAVVDIALGVVACAGAVVCAARHPFARRGRRRRAALVSAAAAGAGASCAALQRRHPRCVARAAVADRRAGRSSTADLPAALPEPTDAYCSDGR